MNKEIQVGEYIRTIDGKIGTIKQKIPIYENEKIVNYQYLTSLNEFYYTAEQLKECGWKLYKTIIDLIEVGDYVNGNRVYDKYSTRVLILTDKTDTFDLTKSISEEDIQTIVTHEQFKSMEYRVGGEDE